jgi:bifunctional polynucleotide phosphatase/kinase
MISRYIFKDKKRRVMDDTILRAKVSRRAKFAIYDFDWTLVKPRDGRRFPKDAADWQYIRESVPAVVRKYAKTHQTVIVTDQSKPWKIDQIKAVVADLGIDPITVVIGVKTQKPETGLFETAFPNFKPEKAFYVGDAAGRHDDWSDKDKVFALRLGVTFHTPEDVFPLDPIPELPKAAAPAKKNEVVIMVGYPASGKTTIAKDLGYHRVDGDALKTASAMIKDAEKHVSSESIVFDSTAGTAAKRAEFVKFAQKHDLPVRVFWVQTPIDVAMERNKQRAAAGGPKVPDVVFYVFRKKFESPSADEGFSIVKIG